MAYINKIMTLQFNSFFVTLNDFSFFPRPFNSVIRVFLLLQKTISTICVIISTFNYKKLRETEIYDSTCLWHAAYMLIKDLQYNYDKEAWYLWKDFTYYWVRKSIVKLNWTDSGESGQSYI